MGKVDSNTSCRNLPVFRLMHFLFYTVPFKKPDVCPMSFLLLLLHMCAHEGWVWVEGGITVIMLLIMWGIDGNVFDFGSV